MGVVILTSHARSLAASKMSAVQKRLNFTGEFQELSANQKTFPAVLILERIVAGVCRCG